MNVPEVGPLNLGDELLPWLQRINVSLERQPDRRSKNFYAGKILERLQGVDFLEVDFMVSSDTVLGKDHTRPANKRFLFPRGFMFFGRLESFGYIHSDNERVKGLTVVFDEAEPIDYTALKDDQADGVVIALEAPISQVTTLLPTAA